MTEEEKKAIEKFKTKIKYHLDNPLGTFVYTTLDDHYLKVILNLIDKLQKEKDEILNSKVGVDLSFDDYIPKDIIREKIKQLENKREQLGIFKSGIYSSGIYKISLIIAAYKELLEEEIENGRNKNQI